MNGLEEYIQYILNKKGLEKIEYECKKIYLNNSDKNDRLKIIYEELLKNNIYIICLLFTNRNKIYVDKNILIDIEYFKNMFDICSTYDVITEIKLEGILDNFKCMREIIHFVKNGWIYDTLDAIFLYDLVLIDRYLLGVICNKNYLSNCNKDEYRFSVSGCPLKAHRHKLLEQHMFGHFNIIKTDLYYYNRRYTKEYYDAIHNLCILYKVKIECLNNKIFNFDTGFMDSSLYVNMNDNEKNSVNKRITKLDYELSMIDNELEIRPKKIAKYIHHIT